MKKIYRLWFALALAGCGTGSTLPSTFESSSPLQEFHYFCGSLYNQRKLSAKIAYGDASETYCVDGKSYYRESDRTTWFKCVFSEEYMVYRGEELLDREQYAPTDLAEQLIDLINPNRFNAERFDCAEGQYVLKQGKEDGFLALFPEEVLENLTVTFDGEAACFAYGFASGSSARISFRASEETIVAYLQDDAAYASYYETYRTAYSEIKEKMEADEDFTMLIVSSTCAACEAAQSLYYEFCIEYHTSFFPVLFLDTMSREEKDALYEPMSGAYLSQEEDYRLPGYDEYPAGYLTPTAVQVSSGSVRRVMPGFSLTMAELLFRMCSE